MNKNKNKTLLKIIKKSVMSLTIAVMMTLSTFITGCASSPGRDGKNGSIWYSGLNVAEYVNDGVDGDFFFDSDDKILYQKVSGEWVQISDIKQFAGFTPTVSINSDGYWVINGNTTIFKCTGKVGNTPYIHLNTWWIDGENTEIPAVGIEGQSAFEVYLEANPAYVGDIDDWIESLKGEKGEQGVQGNPGATWLTGFTNPSDSLGKNGDFYLNTITFNLFKKVNGKWGEPIGNVKGGDGDSGYDRLYTSKTGTSDTPVFLDEKDVNLYDIKLADESQKTIIHGTNRLNLDKVKFSMSGYSSTHTVKKEDNGLVLEAIEDRISKDEETGEDVPKKLSSVYAYYEYIAEFDGTLWLSCDAELDKEVNGDVHDIGMRMNVNGTAQYLSRGEGKLSESVVVQKGDVVKITFYIRINSYKKNKIRYKNIMLQYNTLTDYVPYIEDESNYQKTIVFDGSDDYAWITTSTKESNSADESEKSNYYAVYTNISIDDIVDGVLPASNNEIANVKVTGINLVSYNGAYNNNIGIGISTTGKVLLYPGNGYNKSNIKSYLADNPITITYESKIYNPTSLDDIKYATGYIIESEGDFTVNYSYLDQKKNLKVVNFGDSITGLATNGVSYSAVINRISNIETYNVGFSGTTWTDHGGVNHNPFSMNRLVDSICAEDFSTQEAKINNLNETYQARFSVLKSIDFNEIDYITIFYGTNDWNYGRILKSEDDSAIENKQQTNVEDAMIYSINKLKEKFPHLKIIVITPYWLTFDDNNTDENPNKNGDYLVDYVKYIEQVASSLEVDKVFNLYELFDFINYDTYVNYMYDGVHPSNNLSQILAEFLIKEIDNLEKIK